jgi:hypothetical protein
MSGRITWEEIAILHPTITATEWAVLDVADRARDGEWPDWCANEYWYERVKPMLRLAVGNEAHDHLTRAAPDMLRSREAYDVAYQHLWGLLPDCMHQGMCRRGVPDRSQAELRSILEQLYAAG